MTAAVTSNGELTVGELTALAPVIAVVAIEDVATAVPLARALVAGGLPVIEVTLRTADAIESIRQIAIEVEGAVVGAGTVTRPEQVPQAIEAGAQFLVTPGTTPRLLDALEATGAPFVPGACTPSEVIALIDRGVTVAKLFPAQASGGVAMLRALAGPFPGISFCPTGGIDQQSAADYLALPNVCCVGGSWMLPDDAIAAHDWTRIEALARSAATLRGPTQSSCDRSKARNALEQAKALLGSERTPGADAR